MLDPTTAHAERLREHLGISWEYACQLAERDRDAGLTPDIQPVHGMTRTDQVIVCALVGIIVLVGPVYAGLHAVLS